MAGVHVTAVIPPSDESKHKQGVTAREMNDSAVVFYVFDDSDRFLNTLVLQAMSKSSDSKKTNWNGADLRPNEIKFDAALKADGYFLSAFIHTVETSDPYFRIVIKRIFNSLKNQPKDRDVRIRLQLVKPKSEILDYAWNKRITEMVSRRQQLEYAMSWLSTLGGAFSALGDAIDNYAKVAGRISIQQFKIAYQLGEPSLVARCRLYMALSLIQLGKLAAAKRVVRKQYELANILKDVRLQNMCKGIWAKLQYSYREIKQKNH